MRPPRSGLTRRRSAPVRFCFAPGKSRTTIFLTDMGDFQTVNEVYATYFKDNPPARSTVAVSALPKAANVEIEVIAMANDGNEDGKTVSDTSG